MAKKRKRAKSYMMVIRVSVPARQALKMKAYQVLGVLDRGSICYDLPILSAYYDKPGMPNARR